jgi:MFS family permease
LALTLTDDARLVSLAAFAAFLPWMVLALPAGVLVDRSDRRRLMVMSNVVRLGLSVVLAVGAAAGWLSVWLLLGLIFVIGCFEVVFDSSAQAFRPSIVAPEQLARANGLLDTGQVVIGGIAGLPLGAVLFAIGAGLPFAIDAASFAIAAVLISTIRITAPPRVAEHSAHDDGSLSSGLRWLLAHPVLRPMVVAFTLVTLGLAFGQGIFVKYAVDELGIEEWAFGVLLALTAIGAATGGLIGARLVGRIGLSGGVVGSYWMIAAGHLLYGVLDVVWLVGVVSFGVGFAIAIWNVATITTRQRLAPPELIGRVNSAYRWLGAVATVVGILAGGAIAHAWTLRTPFLVAAVVTGAAGLLYTRPLARGLSGT